MSAQSKASEGNLLFPVFLKIDKLNLLVVGGGNVGLEKLEALLKNNTNATVTLVGTTIRAEIYELAKVHPSVKLISRSFEPKDLTGVDVLILATANRKTNLGILALAKERHILTNVADTPGKIIRTSAAISIRYSQSMS